MAATNTTYTKTGTFLPSNAQGVSYFWIVNGNILSGQGTNTISYQFTTAGTRNITFTAFNDCSSVDKTIAYEVCEPPVGVSIVAQSPPPYYYGQNYVFTATTTAGSSLNYTWNVSGGSTIFSTLGNQVTITAGPGTGASETVISVLVTNCSGLNASDSILIYPQPVPPPTTPITPVTPSASCNEYTVLNNSGTNYSYTYNNGVGVVNRTINAGTTHFICMPGLFSSVIEIVSGEPLEARAGIVLQSTTSCTCPTTVPTAPATPVTPVTPVVACIPLTSCTFS